MRIPLGILILDLHLFLLKFKLLPDLQLFEFPFFLFAQDFERFGVVHAREGEFAAAAAAAVDAGLTTLGFLVEELVGPGCDGEDFGLRWFRQWNARKSRIKGIVDGIKLV